MKVRGADFVLYEVADLDRSIEFYRDVLGMELEMHMPDFRWAEFDVKPTALALFVPDRPPKAGGSIWLAVDDVTQAVEELKGKGVPVIMETFEYPHCWHAAVTDPDGNVVGLHQRKDGSFG